MRKIFLLISIFFTFSSYAQWSNMGSGFNADVNALVVHNGELYAGGNFTASGSTTTNYIARWNGSTWLAVGTGTNGTVFALASYNGELYAGGLFSTAGGNTAANIAKWNGSTWVQVGNGLAGTAGTSVRSLYVWNNVLYAGGTFNQSGSASVSKVARLNGTAWAQVGGGAPPSAASGVYAISQFNGALFVGGQGSAPFMNKLNGAGTGWDMLSTDLSGGFGVYALVEYPYATVTNKVLWVGGQFSTPSVNCATYDLSGSFGTSFNTFSGSKVNALLANFTKSMLYAGGSFTVNGISNLAKKPVSTPWATESSNFNAGINALAFHNGYLVAGGAFTSPGTRIARFATTIGIEESDNLVRNTLYPNPVSGISNLTVETKQPVLKPMVFFYDELGKQVIVSVKLNIQTAEKINYIIRPENLSSGIYTYILTDNHVPVASGKFMVE